MIANGIHHQNTFHSFTIISAAFGRKFARIRPEYRLPWFVTATRLVRL